MINNKSLKIGNIENNVYTRQHIPYPECRQNTTDVKKFLSHKLNRILINSKAELNKTNKEFEHSQKYRQTNIDKEIKCAKEKVKQLKNELAYSHHMAHWFRNTSDSSLQLNQSQKSSRSSKSYLSLPPIKNGRINPQHLLKQRCKTTNQQRDLKVIEFINKMQSNKIGLNSGGNDAQKETNVTETKNEYKVINKDCSVKEQEIDKKLLQRQQENIKTQNSKQRDIIVKARSQPKTFKTKTTSKQLTEHSVLSRDKIKSNWLDAASRLVKTKNKNENDNIKDEEELPNNVNNNVMYEIKFLSSINRRKKTKKVTFLDRNYKRNDERLIHQYLQEQKQFKTNQREKQSKII